MSISLIPECKTFSWHFWINNSQYLCLYFSIHGFCSLNLRSDSCSLPPTLIRPFSSRNGISYLIFEFFCTLCPSLSDLISLSNVSSWVTLTQYTSAAINSSAESSPGFFMLERVLVRNLFTHAVILRTVLNLLYLHRSSNISFVSAAELYCELEFRSEFCVYLFFWKLFFCWDFWIHWL